MSLVEITAQVFLFFAAGFETSSTTSSYAMYELAKNKHVQDKLREEIDRVTEKHNGIITYECILEMEYLTQVIEGRYYCIYLQHLFTIFKFINLSFSL